MKIIIAALAITALLTQSAFCGGTEFEADNGPAKKFSRGVANFATCPLEIVTAMGEENKKSGPVAGLVYGGVKGTLNMFKRGFVGIYEMVTFPIPAPQGYAPILEDPEFYFENRNCFYKGKKKTYY